jgi:hypothetical protein
MNILKMKICSAFFITSLLSACSSSSGGGDSDDSLTFEGNSSPAVIDNSNAQSIGETSGEAVLQASSSSALPTGFETSEQVDLTPIHLSVIETSKNISTLPSGIDVSSQVCTGGGSANTSIPSSSGKSVTKTTYNNCTITSGTSSFTIDGKVIITFEDIEDPTAGFTMSYQGVTVSGISEEEVTLNYTYSCTNLSDFRSCTTSSVFKGSDGETHEVSDFEITGSSSSGYNGSASFNHYSFGSVSVNVTNLTYGSCGGSPDGGSISFSSTNGSSGTINFSDDCTVSGTWTSGSGSGSF